MFQAFWGFGLARHLSNTIKPKSLNGLRMQHAEKNKALEIVSRDRDGQEDT